MTAWSAAVTPSSGGGTIPLWLVCGLAFAGILAVALVLILGPGSAAVRRKRQARVDELRRYRVLAVQADTVPAASERHNSLTDVTTRLVRVLDRYVRARGQRERIVGRLERSGVHMRPEEWAAIEISAIVVGAAVVTFWFGLLFGVLLGAPGGWLVCHLFLLSKTSRRRRAFELQLPDALQLMAGALRTGFGLAQSIGAVTRDAADPVAEEFSRVMQEVRLGAELEDALDGLAARMCSYDLELIVMAIRTAREIGGNMAEVLQTAVATMRERMQLGRQVRVLTAEGRLSAKLLTGLPVLMAGYLLVFKKGYLQPLYTTPVGVIMLVLGVVLLVVGSLWLRKLTKIEV